MAGKVQLTEELIRRTIQESKPKSISALYRNLGGRSNPASSTIAAIKKLVPEVDAMIRANRTPTQPQ